MHLPKPIPPLITLLMIVATIQLSGCAVFTVADAVVTTAATAVKITAKTVGAAADLVLPSGEKKAEKKSDAPAPEKK